MSYVSVCTLQSSHCIFQAYILYVNIISIKLEVKLFWKEINLINILIFVINPDYVLYNLNNYNSPTKIHFF